MASITTRQTAGPTGEGVTNNGAPLTNEQLDQNFIAINSEVLTKAPTASPVLTGTPTINSDTAFGLPSGNIAARPTGVAGYIRFNSETASFEGFNGTVWGTIGGGSWTTLTDIPSTISNSGYLSTATSAGTITLTATSPQYQRFTGTTASQIVRLPPVVLGRTVIIDNASTQTITVQLNGGTALTTISTLTAQRFTCIGVVGGTTTADWKIENVTFNSTTGTGSFVLATNPTINNLRDGYTTTVTSATTVTLTASSNYLQRFTGSTAQTVTLPVTSTLTLGTSYSIENQSSANITVNSSGANLVVTIIPGVTVHLTCIDTGVNTAAGWDVEYDAFASITGTGSVVLSTSPTLTTPTLGVASVTSINKVAITAPTTSATLTIANTKTLTANSTLTLGGTDGKTLTVNNNLTLGGTDGSSVAFGGGGTVAYTGNNLGAFAATSSSQLASVISDETGSGPLVFATTPTLTTPVLTTPTINNGYIEEPYTFTVSTAAYTIDLTNGSVQFLTLGTTQVTFTFPTATAGSSFVLFLVQDATGNRTAGWPGSPTLKWPGNVPPALSTGGTKIDKFVFTADGTSWYGSMAGMNY